MIEYLNILLDNTSVSYCCYDNERADTGFIPLNTLRDGIKWSMKNNMMVQYIFPEGHILPEYFEIIESIDNVKIVPSNSPYVEYADVIVYNGVDSIEQKSFKHNTTTVLRTNKKELFSDYSTIQSIISKVPRLSLVITDIYDFSEKDIEQYKKILDSFVEFIYVCFSKGNSVQLNLVTDRIFLKGMNNCGAGKSNITLAPDGKFYICPAFYQAPEASSTELEQTFNIGSVSDGLKIKNCQLYDIKNAVLCNICDAYQCKRCIWMNRKQTLEMNTPSREQCVVSHIERNASMKLLNKLQDNGIMLDFDKIQPIDYLDPFDILEL